MSGTSAFADVATIAPQQIWAGVVGRVVQGERLTMALIELEPDSVVPEHSHSNEQLGVLLRGSLRLRVDAETQDLGPGGTCASVPRCRARSRPGPKAQPWWRPSHRRETTGRASSGNSHGALRPRRQTRDVSVGTPRAGESSRRPAS